MRNSSHRFNFTWSDEELKQARHMHDTFEEANCVNMERYP